MQIPKPPLVSETSSTLRARDPMVSPYSRAPNHRHALGWRLSTLKIGCDMLCVTSSPTLSGVALLGTLRYV